MICELCKTSNNVRQYGFDVFLCDSCKADGISEKSNCLYVMAYISSLDDSAMNLIQLPFRLVWNILVIVGSISLLVLWVGFIFGSVIGVVLMLIFFPSGFLLPIDLMMFCVKLWPCRNAALNLKE
jgi:hypothetical protein